MDGVGTPIIGRPRPLPGHDTPNPAYHPHTLNYEEPVSWQQLLKAVHGVYGYFKKTEILVDGLPVQISQPEEILQIPEAKAISIRGVLTIIDVPVVVTFYNQADYVNVMVACVNEEFQNTNYEKFNKSMSQIMDSLELMMYIPTANQN